MRFRNWLAENLLPNSEKELQRLWSDTFKALGVGGLADEDAAQQSLSKITYNNRNIDRQSVFKGKQAVRKRLENGQIFNRLQSVGDPELRQTVDATRKWLDTDDGELSSNASTTVGNLLQKLFGDKYYHQFIDSDMPKVDKAKAQVEPQLPRDSMGNETPAPNNSMDAQTPQPQGQPPMGGMMGQQPQVPQMMAPPQPGAPMPPRPAGAELGLF